MESVFSFLRGRGQSPIEEDSAPETPAPLSLETARPIVEAARPTPVAEAVRTTPALRNGAPSINEVLQGVLDGLKKFIPPPVGAVPDPGISATKVDEKPAGLGNYVGQDSIGQFSIVLKGSRLDAGVRFQLWATSPNEVDQAIDALSGNLLEAKEALWIAGFLRITAEGSSVAEHLPSLNAWRRTADYHILYEFRYTDTDGAQSLIARIPIHTDPEVPNSPERETAILTDEMVRWDEEDAPAMELRGRSTINQLSLWVFIPGTVPSDPVMLLRTFAGATTPPTSYPDLDQFLTALSNPATPERNGQVTFASFGDFITAATSLGTPIELGDWDEDTDPDQYQPLVLEFTLPIPLPMSNDRLQLIYHPGAADPKLDHVAVVYIKANE